MPDSAPITAERRPLLLVVEDDRDFLAFLVAELEESYEVLSATNGREGLRLAQARVPDLVLTDLMMPLMGGVEMCREIRGHPGTAHIPVIMLTAMSSVESQIEGLGTGADDYVTKPLILEVLLARIRNLLESRKRLRDRFRTASQGLAHDTPDQDFMKRAINVLQEHASDPAFGAEEFAQRLSMSLSTLHRKLRTLTGDTPAKMIWDVRLANAAVLLRTSSLRITEIAFEVGYADSNHFGRQFKQCYGMTPSQYREAGAGPGETS